MTKEKIIDNIARLNSETWRDREEVRAEIAKLLSELKKALEQPTSDDAAASHFENLHSNSTPKNTDEYKVGYKVGYEVGVDLTIKGVSEFFVYADEKFIRECYPSESNWNLFDLNAKYGLAELLKTWNDYQNKIKVGDVVRFNEKCHNYNQVKDREYLVLHIFDNGFATLLYNNGDTGCADLSLLYKTKKHIREAEQLLSKLVESEKK